jgi:Protein-L-isoaspartate carboxylmethyltransferase
LQSSLLEVKRGDRVLEVGTGSAYQATVLAALGAMVFTIERHKELYEKNLMFFPFKKKYPTIKFFHGDGFAGLPKYAPFDKIIITAAAPEIPKALLAQLKVRGVMVLPLNDAEQNVQIMTKLIKQIDNSYTVETFGKFQFVPMLRGKVIK